MFPEKNSANTSRKTVGTSCAQCYLYHGLVRESIYP